MLPIGLYMPVVGRLRSKIESSQIGFQATRLAATRRIRTWSGRCRSVLGVLVPFVAVLALGPASSASAQDGSLDTSFSSDGMMV